MDYTSRVRLINAKDEVVVQATITVSADEDLKAGDAIRADVRNLFREHADARIEILDVYNLTTNELLFTRVDSELVAARAQAVLNERRFTR